MMSDSWKFSQKPVLVYRDLHISGALLLLSKIQHYSKCYSTVYMTNHFKFSAPHMCTLPTDLSLCHCRGTYPSARQMCVHMKKDFINSHWNSPYWKTIDNVKWKHKWYSLWVTGGGKGKSLTLISFDHRDLYLYL